MAEDDIYKNKERYEKFVSSIQDYTFKPAKNGKRKYWIKNKDNVQYFKRLFNIFETRDTSYIRRLRLCRTFLIVNYVLDQDLAESEREDIEKPPSLVVFPFKFLRSVTVKPSLKLVCY